MWPSGVTTRSAVRLKKAKVGKCGKAKILGTSFRRRRRRNPRRPARWDHASLRSRDHGVPENRPRPAFPRIADLGRRADIPRRQSRVRRNVQRPTRTPQRDCHCRGISVSGYFMRGKRHGHTRQKKRTVDRICAYHSRNSTPFRIRGKFPISCFKGTWRRTRRHGRVGVQWFMGRAFGCRRGCKTQERTLLGYFPARGLKRRKNRYGGRP